MPGPILGLLSQPNGVLNQSVENQKTRGLLSSQSPNTYRGTILPFEKNMDTGEVNLAVPGLLKGAYDSTVSGLTLPGDVYAGKSSPYDYGRVLDMAGLLTLGSGGVPISGNEIRSGVGIPKIRSLADEVFEKLKKEGLAYSNSAPILSTNRYGQKSAYIDVPGGRLRISDHSANMDFRPNEIHVSDTLMPDEIVSAVKSARKKALEGLPDRKAASAQRKVAENADRIRKEEATSYALQQRQLKIDFFNSHPEFDNATETARKKAWDEFKRSEKLSKKSTSEDGML